MNHRSLQIPILFFIIISLPFCKKTEKLAVIDKNKVAQSRINLEINDLLQKAGNEKDDNNKAKLLGKASELLIRKGDYKKAIEIARKAKRANPSQKNALATIGEYYLHQGKLNEAIFALEDLLTRNKDYDRANYLIGNAYFLKEDYTSARRYYELAIANNGKYLEALNNLAAIYLTTGKADTALNFLKKAIAINPDHALSYKNAGIASEKANQKKDARRFYEKYLELNPYGDDAESVKSWISKI